MEPVFGQIKLDNRRLIEPLEISYFVFCWTNRTAAAAAVRKVQKSTFPQLTYPQIVL